MTESPSTSSTPSATTLASANTPSPTQGLTTRDRVAIAVLLTANFTLAVDFSILNVALPHLGRELGFATGDLQWVVTAFALCAAGFTLFFGRAADLFGRRRLFLAGMVLLGAGSLAGGLAQDPTLLIIARIAQGLATAMVTPAALSLLTTMFPEGPARSRVLGLNGALMAAGFTTGAVVGGLLTGVLDWRWAFFINVMVAVAVTAVAPAVLTETPANRRPRLDVAGAVTVTLGLVALVYGAATAGSAGWADRRAWGSFLAAGLVIALFWWVEHRVSEPLVSPPLLRRSNIAWGNVAGLLAFATETSLVFLLTLYLQDVLGFGAVTAGLVLAVLGVGTVIGGLIAPRIIGRTGAKRAIVVGFIVQGSATAPLAFIGTGHAWVWVLLVLTFVGGVANLIAIVGYTVAATAGVGGDQQGLATGLVTMSQQIGITLGTPVMSAVAAGVAGRAGAEGIGAGLLPGLQVAVGVNAAVCVAAAVVIGVALRVPRPAH